MTVLMLYKEFSLLFFCYTLIYQAVVKPASMLKILKLQKSEFFMGPQYLPTILN